MFMFLSKAPNDFVKSHLYMTFEVKTLISRIYFYKHNNFFVKLRGFTLIFSQCFGKNFVKSRFTKEIA